MRGSWKLALAATLGIPAIAASQPADTTARSINRLFDAFRDTEGPGCALAVSRNGQLVYEHAYGMANLETGTPIRPASIFHVASVSKQFTAMAIMLLAGDGRLSVDDNIRKYLPEIPDYGTPITIRHLLTHTSGLRDQWDLIGLARGGFEEYRITEADVLDIVPRQRALNFTPGSEYLYSNTGFTLLGVIVKRVSGKSLRDFAEERIFRPLGMSSTHFHDDYTMVVPGRTSAYARRGNGWRVSIPNYDTYGATSLFTTVGDLLKWEENFAKPVVGDRALFEQMETPARLSNGDTTTYGFGLAIARYRGARVVEHTGGDAGYRSYLGRFPEHGLAIALACNASIANTIALTRGVADLYLRGVLTPAVVADPGPEPVELALPLLQRRVGAYLQPNTLQLIELSLHDGRLLLGRAAGPTLTPLAENRFRVGGQPVELVFAAGERAGFERRLLSGGRPVAFEWRPPAVVSTPALAGYAGHYFSEELNAYARVTASDSAVEVRVGTLPGTVFRPVFLNGFFEGGTLIQFTRSGGTVTGFEISTGRVRRVKFARVGAKGARGAPASPTSPDSRR
jgi:CubicO group peptidase (beta-lactamase class C family)